MFGLHATNHRTTNYVSAYDSPLSAFFSFFSGLCFALLTQSELRLRTLNDDWLVVRKDPETSELLIGQEEARVQLGDILLKNGVAHAIDKVLVPEGLNKGKEGQSSSTGAQGSSSTGERCIEDSVALCVTRPREHVQFSLLVMCRSPNTHLLHCVW